MSEQTIVYLIFTGGALFSIIVPYLQNWVESREPFDWRKPVGQALAVLGTVGAQILNVVDVLADATYAEAFFYGMGMSVAGRIVQKGFDLARKGNGG